MAKIVDKDEKKKLIIKAALDTYAEKGVKNSRIIDIARNAGIGKGTVYEYFRSADEILLASYYMLMENMESEIFASIANITDPIEQLSGMIRIPFEQFTQLSDDYMAIFIEYWSEGIKRDGKSNELANNFRSIYQNFRNQMVDIINTGIKQGKFRQVNAVSVASALMAIIDGLYLQLMLDKDAFSPNQIIDDSIDMILNGVLKNEK